MISPPNWLSQFANDVTRSFHPYDHLPPIGCHFHQSKKVWEVTLFASRTEIVGGSEDGRTTQARFNVDIKVVLGLFSRVDRISWQTQSFDQYDELGSHLSIEGLHADQQIWLRIPATAPARFDTGRLAIVSRREFEEVW